ncbi:MAG: AbrB/MazE/SpoVT family DNA-binding domain-containing protein [Nitrospiria bacterium]
MRVTSKGQVTIPLEIREKAGLLPHTEVEFELVNSKVILKKMDQKQTRGEELIKRMRGKATLKMTTEEIMKLTRRHG